MLYFHMKLYAMNLLNETREHPSFLNEKNIFIVVEASFSTGLYSNSTQLRLQFQFELFNAEALMGSRMLFIVSLFTVN